MTRLQDFVFVEDTKVGRGLFAAVNFGAEEIVLEFRGDVVDHPEYESDYCVDLGNDAKMEPGIPYRFVNHRCEPNCELVLWKKRRYGDRKYARVWLQTLRPIEAGEEFTIDYAWPAVAAIPCHCNSRKCRKWIVHPDEVNSLPHAMG